MVIRPFFSDIFIHLGGGLLCQMIHSFFLNILGCMNQWKPELKKLMVVGSIVREYGTRAHIHARPCHFNDI